MPRRPNVVLILADDLGYECLGCYGGESYETPRLDEMAAEGVRFTDAHSLPLCTPSRLQLMTGRYNFRNWTAFGLLDPEERTFAHHMNEAGYATCISGKWQLYSYNPPDFEPEWRGEGTHPDDAAFDEYHLWHAEHTEEKGSRYADPVVLENGTYRDDTEGEYGPDLHTDYLLDFARRHREEPFFAYYPMALTHGPFTLTPHSDGWAGDRHESDPDNFGDMVEYADHLVGRILDGLEEMGIREETLVLFTGDNGTPGAVTSTVDGEAYPGGKGETTDAGTHVPLLATWRGTAPEGAVCEDLVDFADFLPTMADLAGHDLPDGEPFDGRSFLPQVRGERGDPRDWLYAWHDPRPGWDKAEFELRRWARDERWKLYGDGALYDLERGERGTDPVTEETPATRAAREKLEPVIERMVAEERRYRDVGE